MQKNIHLKLIILILIIVTAVLAWFLFNKKISNVVESPSDEMGTSRENLIKPEPIKKSAELLDLEQNLKVEREIVTNPDGSVTIKARLANTSKIKEGIVLNDFVDTIKFADNVNLKDTGIITKNGKLFPQSKDLTISQYGPGPTNKKKTKVNISILDINFDNKTSNTDLYEIKFTPGKKIEPLVFETEIRSDRYILNLR